MLSPKDIDFRGTTYFLVSWAGVVLAWACARAATITTKVFRNRRVEEWEKWLTRHVNLIIQIVSIFLLLVIPCIIGGACTSCLGRSTSHLMALVFSEHTFESTRFIHIASEGQLGLWSYSSDWVGAGDIGDVAERRCDGLGGSWSCAEG